MDTTNTRKGDAPFLQPSQSSRFIEITNEWFFFTREKELLGPYRSRRIVEHAARLYGKKKRLSDNKTTSILKLFANDEDGTEDSGNKNNETIVEQSTNVLDFEHPNWDL